MESNGGIEGNVALQERLPKLRDEVVTHGQRQAGVREHEWTGGAAGYWDANSRDSAQTSVLDLDVEN